MRSSRLGGPRAQTRVKAQPRAESGARGPPRRDERMFYHGYLIFSQNLDMFEKKNYPNRIILS